MYVELIACFDPISGYYLPYSSHLWRDLHLPSFKSFLLSPIYYFFPVLMMPRYHFLSTKFTIQTMCVKLRGICQLISTAYKHTPTLSRSLSAAKKLGSQIAFPFSHPPSTPNPRNINYNDRTKNNMYQLQRCG